MPYAVLAAALVMDQLVKYLVHHNIPWKSCPPSSPTMVELTYCLKYNRFLHAGGAAWLLTLISAVMSVVLGVAVWKSSLLRPFAPHPGPGRRE